MKKHSALYLIQLVPKPHYNQGPLSCFKNAHEYQVKQTVQTHILLFWSPIRWIYIISRATNNATEVVKIPTNVTFATYYKVHLVMWLDTVNMFNRVEQRCWLILIYNMCCILWYKDYNDVIPKSVKMAIYFNPPIPL